jgi:hypothetical protein
MRRLRVSAFLACLLACLVYGGTVRPEWVIPSEYRIAVVVDPGSSKRLNAPVGASVDFGKVFRKNSIPGRFDRNSIRVVRFDPATGRPIPYRDSSQGYEVPYQLTGDFTNDDAGMIFWRMQDRSATHFHIYFDSLSSGKKQPPKVTGLVGIGDSFHYNDGQPGFANSAPLHSTLWHLDWDGDNLRDLIGIGFRTYEYGAPLEENLGNAVYFYKNIGTTQQPLFASPYRMKADDGGYLRSDQLGQNMFPVDWNNDGHIDFIGFKANKLLLWENTGKRDRNNLWILKQPREIMELEESDFRRSLPGGEYKPSFNYRGARMVDWDGDGDLDLLVELHTTNILRKVDPKRGIIPYGASLNFFELYENIGTDATGNPKFAKPVVLREGRGLPITAFGSAAGGPEYVDWDSDGDCDLLFYDLTNRPLEGGRLMWSENDGTREKPLLTKPMPILEISDSPIVVDWNGDGRFDLVAGGEFFENINPKSGSGIRTEASRKSSGTRRPHPWSLPKFISRGLAQQINPMIVTYFTTSVDWDGDGILDLLSGYQSNVVLYHNKGTLLDPVFDRGVKLQAGGKPIYMPNWFDPQSEKPTHWGPQGPSEPTFGWTIPTAADWDGDGDLDLFVTGQRWQVLYFENIGTRTNPRLAPGREVRCDGDPHEFSWRSKVSVGDIDGDGEMELVVTSNRDNIFYAYKPKKEQKDPTVLELYRDQPLLLEDGSPVRGWYGNQNNNGDNHSILVDWDSDGDLDLLNGSLYGVWYYENVGTKTAPKFKARGKFKAGGEIIHTFNHAGSFDAADWNGDGRLDLIMGSECPSDQPRGADLHLFDRFFIENDLPTAKIFSFEKR